MEIYKPNFEHVNEIANEILLISNTISDFPFSVTKMIAEMTDIQCCSFKRAAGYGINTKALGSKSAVIADYNGRCIIFYNECEPEERVRFSLLHELGHYILEHDLDTKDIQLYDKQEIEANCFAAQLLMPEQILLELQHRGKRIDSSFLMCKFRVSKEAATKRIDTMHRINMDFRNKSKQDFDEWLTIKYSAFLDSVLPQKNSINWFEDEYERQRERDNWF